MYTYSINMILDNCGKMGSIFFCYFMHLTNLTTMKKWGKVKCNFADITQIIAEISVYKKEKL